MKIKDLITRLSSLDPNGEVTGVEHLQVQTSLYTEVPPQKQVGFYLKGKNRIDAATTSGSPEEVARKFNVTPAYILALRKQLLEGKLTT